MRWYLGRTMACRSVAGLVVTSLALACAACKGPDAEMLGSFPGDWTVYRVVFVALPDGGNADQSAYKGTPGGPDKGEGDVTVAKVGPAYEVAFKARFTSICKLTAKLVGDRIVVDDDQTCPLEVPGFNGVAVADGKLWAVGDGALKANLNLTPRGAQAGSSVRADFVGNRNKR